MRVVWRTLGVCLVAGINIFSTLLPIWPWRYHVIAHGLPLSVILAAQDVTLLLGVSMLLLAYPAALGHRRMSHLLMLCAALAIVSNVVKGLDIEEALANGILLTWLWRSRTNLSKLPLRYTVVDVVRLALLIVVIARAYMLAGRVVLHGLYSIVRSGFTRVTGLHDEPNWVHHVQFMLTAKLALQTLWFHDSQYLLPLFLVGIFVVFSWTSLLRPASSASEIDDPYGRFGRASHNSLAYLARRTDVSTFVCPGGAGVISYKLVGHVALQVGAVLAPAESRAAVYQAFRAFCKQHGLIPAAVALSQEEQPLAARAGMHTLTIGTEAIVDLGDFAVEKLGKKMRWVQRSLSKRGYHCDLVPATETSALQRAAMHHIEAEWREERGGQTHGFCMTLGRVPTPEDPECLLGFMYDPAGVPIAFLTLLPGGDGVYSLDLTRRRHDAPNATMEFLLMEVLVRLKERGAGTVSLNFSTFSSLAASRIGAALLTFCGVAFQLRSLETFNNKFKPRWVPRYAAFPSWYTLPDVAYAILSIEGVDRMLLNAAARATGRLTGREREGALDVVSAGERA